MSVEHSGTPARHRSLGALSGPITRREHVVTAARRSKGKRKTIVVDCNRHQSRRSSGLVMYATTYGRSWAFCRVAVPPRAVGVSPLSSLLGSVPEPGGALGPASVLALRRAGLGLRATHAPIPIRSKIGGVAQKRFPQPPELHAPISLNVPPVHAVMNGYHRTLDGVTHALCVRDPVQERR